MADDLSLGAGIAVGRLSAFRRRLASAGIVLLSAAAGLVSTGAAGAQETVLYGTDFSEFPVGLDMLAPNEGWLTTNPGEGVHGIAEGVMPGLGRSGFVGDGNPSTDWVSVYRPLSYDPVASGTPEVHWSLRFLVEDSSNGRYDSFFFSLYNETEELLAAVVLDNTEEFFGLWRYDGEDYNDLFIAFQHGVVHELEITLDFAANRWSVTFDGEDLFTDEVLHAGVQDLDLGDFAAEWELFNELLPGDNLLYFDEWRVTATGPGEGGEVFAVRSIERLENGDVRLTWPAQGGEVFRVEHSPELLDWRDDLPDSLVTVGAGALEGVFVDPMPDAMARYYRVRRLAEGQGARADE
ncbi:MAG TPA: hypothetical protein VMN36_03490 [Verrucomicrobiales bacterium]|nr:hypothetical protein [Verrucomicrobiales bacterium]